MKLGKFGFTITYCAFFLISTLFSVKYIEQNAINFFLSDIKFLLGLGFLSIIYLTEYRMSSKESEKK